MVLVNAMNISAQLIINDNHRDRVWLPHHLATQGSAVYFWRHNVHPDQRT